MTHTVFLRAEYVFHTLKNLNKYNTFNAAAWRNLIEIPTARTGLNQTFDHIILCRGNGGCRAGVLTSLPVTVPGIAIPLIYVSTKLAPHNMKLKQEKMERTILLRAL